MFGGASCGEDRLAHDYDAFPLSLLLGGSRPWINQAIPYISVIERLLDHYEGKNIIRGLITRGYSDADIIKITGGNALAFFRRVMGE